MKLPFWWKMAWCLSHHHLQFRAMSDLSNAQGTLGYFLNGHHAFLKYQNLLPEYWTCKACAAAKAFSFPHSQGQAIYIP